MASPHPLTPISIAAVLALSACGGGPADSAAPDQQNEPEQQASPALCPSAEDADNVVDFWAAEEWEKLESRVGKLLDEDEKAEACVGSDELTAFSALIEPASRYATNPSDVETPQDGPPYKSAEAALNEWLSAIGRTDVKLSEKKQEALGYSDPATDQEAVRMGNKKIDFDVLECEDGWLCDIRNFYDDSDPSNGVILMETQDDDGPAFTGDDKEQRNSLVDWVDTWKPETLKEIKIFYYADTDPGGDPADTEPYATIDLK